MALTGHYKVILYDKIRIKYEYNGSNNDKAW